MTDKSDPHETPLKQNIKVSTFATVSKDRNGVNDSGDPSIPMLDTSPQNMNLTTDMNMMQD